MSKKWAVGISGASGAIYAKLLLDELKDMYREDWRIGVVMSENAIYNWELEVGEFNEEKYPFTFYGKGDFTAPFASGSANFDGMMICPCSMGALGRIANGISDDLTSRAADVMLKERKKLILVPRETPFNLIHLRNMVRVSEAGAVVCPAIPSYYSGVKSTDELAMTVVHRVLQVAGFEPDSFQWGKEPTDE